MPVIESSEAVEPKRPPLALETALTWLAKIKAAAVLALLRDPEFALVSMTAFSGFRVNATGYANPLVRRRLAQEAIRDEKFADKLLALAESSEPHPTDSEKSQAQSASVAPREDSGQNAVSSLGGVIAMTDEGGARPLRLAALKTERDRRRRERDEARQSLTEAEGARQEAERTRQQAEAERDEALQQAQRQAQRIARLERQVTKLQSEQAGLMRALRQRGSVR